jgi:ABC-2 type transport system permease protein
MTWLLIRKLLRDLRWPLLVVGLLLCAFQFFWANITDRILGRLAPFFTLLGSLANLGMKNIEDVIFAGPGKITRTLIGGENVTLDNAMDMLSIGYVHPLMVTIFCIWAVGRAAGAIAGELDRGTMELLLAQPLSRTRLLLAHFSVDLLTIPVLCLSLWAGNWLGAWAVSPIRVDQDGFLEQLPRESKAMIRARLESQKNDPEAQARQDKALRIEPWLFWRALVVVAGLMFAVCGITMWLSALGRFRWRVLGVAVFFLLIQFLVNLIGQMWELLEPLRPLTIFYYYQPQQIILKEQWCVTFAEWNGGKPLWNLPAPVVLYGVGLLGYLAAWWTFNRRDLPAPL